jgi:hypothetical protein
MLQRKIAFGLVCITLLGAMFLVNQCLANTDIDVGARAEAYTRIGVGTDNYTFNGSNDLSLNGGNSTLGTSGLEELTINMTIAEQSLNENTAVQNDMLVNNEISQEDISATWIDEGHNSENAITAIVGPILIGLAYVEWRHYTKKNLNSTQ